MRLLAATTCVLGLLLVSCSSLRKGKKEKPEDLPEETVPTRLIVGVIKGVQGKEFVVFKRAGAIPVGAGKELEWVPRNGGEGGLLRLGPEKRGSLFIADILNGKPAVGDLVCFVETAEEKKLREEREKAAARRGVASDPANIDPTGGLLDGSDALPDPRLAPLDAGSLPALRPPPEEIKGSVFGPSEPTSGGERLAPTIPTDPLRPKTPQGGTAPTELPPLSPPSATDSLPPLRPPPN